MIKKYCIEIGTDSHEIIQLLEDKIYEHNSSKTGSDNGCIFTRIVRSENKEIIAGIAGWTWAGVCEIRQLWVHEDMRKNGIGTILLEAAEMHAKSKGCVTILVRSYSFQAPHFYEKYGYKTEYILHDFPDGYSYFIFSKTLTKP